MNLSKKRNNSKIRRSKFTKTMKKGGGIIIPILGIFSVCLSILQFSYYIININKNLQPNGPNVLTISQSELDKIKNSYPPENPPLMKKKDILKIKHATPKVIKDALDQNYIKKIKRKNKNGKLIEGYTLASKGKDLIKKNLEKMDQ